MGEYCKMDTEQVDVIDEDNVMGGWMEVECSSYKYG